MSELFAALAAWAVGIVQSGGYVGVALMTLLENLFPPIPSELILPVAGFLSRRGELAFFGVVVAATAGSLAGALILYELGHRLGEERLRGFIRRYGRWLMLRESDVDQAQQWFERHGDQAVLVARLVPAVRSLISIPAGMAGMSLGPFVAYTALGSGLWNSALVGLGWAVGEHWDRVEPYLKLFHWVALIAMGVGVAWLLWQRKVRRRAPAASRSA
jgi:membrane protein DedA with SNARE-associated domain